MKKEQVKILLIDDDEDDFLFTKDYLEAIPGYKFITEWCSNYKDALEKIQKREHHIYIADYLLGVHTGLDLLKEAVKNKITAPFIILTGKGDLAIDMEAMELGAADYLIKGELDSEKLERSVRYSLERADALKAIKTSEKKFRNIFQRSRDMLFVTDENGYFMDVNDSATRIFKYTRDEFLKMNMKDLFETNQDYKIAEEILRLAGEVNDYEIISRTKDEEKRYCLLSSSVQVTENGKKIYEGIIHNITKRKKAEMDLVTAEKLAVTGRVVRMFAHEVRNPLTNINLAIEQLKVNSIPPEETEEYYEIIRRNSDRINTIITELLSLSRAEQLNCTQHDINEITDEAIEMAKDRIALKNIKVVKNYSHDMCTISIDAGKVRIALLNIILNAVEAMKPSEGILTVSTTGENSKCIVTIEDNGKGIAKENLQRIFEPFYSDKHSGTGLGLSTAHQTLMTHKGTIDVESEPGKGTQFKVSFNYD